MTADEIRMTGILNLVAAGFLLPSLSAMRLNWRYQNQPGRSCFYILLANTLMCLAAGFGYLLDIQQLLYISFFLHYMIIMGYTAYLLAVLHQYRPVRKWPLLLSGACCVVSFVFFHLSGYDTTADPGLVSSGLYLTGQVIASGAVVIGLAVLIIGRQYLDRKEIVFLGLLPVMPLVVGELSKVITAVRLRAPLMALSNMMFHEHLHVTDERRVARQQEQLAQARLAISANQIRPHFIFNSLTAIYYLCDTDPERAKEAIQSFSHYLRTNLELVDREMVIPFDREISHVRYYLDLEMLRYGDRLRIYWDLQARDFMIPVLSVQPLAENAIKHGISDMPEGGALSISSRETADGYEVRVVNEGRPYRSQEVSSDHMAVGLRSVRERVEQLLGGSVEIGVGPMGQGAEAVIRLPKSAATVGAVQRN